MSIQLNLEDWLDLSSQKDLREEQYQQLIESLPEDTSERQMWLNELSVHHALRENRRGVTTEELQDVLRGIAKAPKKPRLKITRPKGSPMFKAIAAMAMGGFLLTITQNYWYERDMGPSRMTSKDDRGVHVTTMTTREQAEKPLPEIERVEFSQPALAKISDDFKNKRELGPKEEHLTPIEEAILLSDEGPSSIASLSIESKSKKYPETFTVRAPTAIAGVRGAPATISHGGFMMPEPTPPQRETYHAPKENKFILTAEDSKSTFSIDVDTASYSNIRRMLRQGKLPPKDAVRIEEMVNNFAYAYPQPKDGQPFSVNTELGMCPWNLQHQILKVGLKGKVDLERPDVHLVFLLDVSGSMSSADKLPLLKRSFKLLLNGLRPSDTVAIVAYAGHTGVVLNPTSASDKEKIIEAMDQLKSSGSTNGTGGIQLAYDLASQNMDSKAINRVILATDGDFNVGISDRKQLEAFIEEKRTTGIELSVLGFGQGNLRDDVMELLANKGNGNYNYIDTLRSARKALVEELSSNLVTIAKDVKIQMVFDPEKVQSFRLIGYENRALEHKDFDDDKKDAGELGMGHTVTALYEIVPTANQSNDGESLGQLRLRYKEPKGEDSQLMETNIPAMINSENSSDYNWAVATAAWGQLLRKSEHVKDYTVMETLALAKLAKGKDPNGYRAEMIQLIEASQDLLDTKFKTDTNLPMWEYRK